jgi:hypothetical protein
VVCKTGVVAGLALPDKRAPLPFRPSDTFPKNREGAYKTQASWKRGLPNPAERSDVGMPFSFVSFLLGMKKKRKEDEKR